MKSYFWYPVWNKTRPDEGLEHLMLGEFHAAGQISAFDQEGQPFRCVYQVRWDGDGVTREINVKASNDQFTRHLSLSSAKEGVWRNAQGVHLTEFDGCLDVDIWPTPFTNSLAIWRLKLSPEERREIRVIHVSAPELIAKPARQAYTQLAPRRYRYEGLDSAYQNELPLDELGVVLDYPRSLSALRMEGQLSGEVFPIRIFPLSLRDEINSFVYHPIVFGNQFFRAPAQAGGVEKVTGGHLR